MTRARIESISPSFIVSNVSRTVAFYRDRLGFEAMYLDPEDDPFFAIVRRDEVMVFLKSVGVTPMPNHSRSPEIKWDAYFYVPDPDALAEEFTDNSAEFRMPLGITTERLRGFEVSDPDGYVLFFGRPELGEERS
jgi:catechol 2,3-dioxygenase-like lactoylglutathione lyase family enzyme